MSVAERKAAFAVPTDDLNRVFKEVFSQLASGVCVVTFWRGGRIHGFTATSVTSVSLQPARLLFCVAQASQSYPSLTPGSTVGISILHAGQRALSDRFAVKQAPGSYDAVGTAEGSERAPLLDGALGHVTARIVDRMASGDHAIVLCDVMSARAASNGTPLLYYRRSYHSLHQSL